MRVFSELISIPKSHWFCQLLPAYKLTQKDEQIFRNKGIINLSIIWVISEIAAYKSVALMVKYLGHGRFYNITCLSMNIFGRLV